MPEDITNIPQETAVDQLQICVFNCMEQQTQKCRKCNRNFCVMHASRFSPNFCQDCFKNISIVEDKFSRTFEDYDLKKDKLSIRRESCTRWYMDGPDWPFLNLWIDSLSDDELKIVWNFHFFVMKTIEVENETRKIEKARTLQSYPVSRITTTTTVKKVAKVQQPETPETIAAKLKKQGVPQNIIDMMIAAMPKS